MQLSRKVHRAALVHGHCHQKSLFGMDDEEKLLKRLGLDFDLLDSGCCGMAGAFGFEDEHYDVSLKAGGRVLLPRVRLRPELLSLRMGLAAASKLLKPGDATLTTLRRS
jgi:Fe-S oxidoreductase